MSDDEQPPPRERSHKRFPVDWRVTLKLPDWGHASRVAAQNASHGGLFVLTSRPPEIGSVVELTIELPDGGKLEVSGTVQHVVTPERALVSGLSPGIGVRIADKHAVDILLLDQMATATAAAGAARKFESAPAPAVPPPRAVGRIGLVGGQMARVVGVDFGTSTTRLACFVGDRILCAADAHGRVAHPSVVSYPAGKTDRPLSGFAARARLGVDPRRTVLGIKRLLGRKLDEPGVRERVAAAPFRVVAAEDGSPSVDLGDALVPCSAIVATMLAHVRALAERHFRRAIRDAVLTVSPDAGDDARAALREAATRAGFEVAGLLDEPIAAALAAGAGGSEPEIVAVADWGGGGFACSLLDIAGDRARLLARDSDLHAGAGELAGVVADLAADGFWRETRIELRQAVIPWQRLLLEAEDAVRGLATEDRVVLSVDAIALAPEPVNLRQAVTADELEAGAAELIAQILAVCRAAVGNAGLAPRQIVRVIATGGAARLPFVRRALASLFERSLDPVAADEATVAGAARRGAAVIRFA